MSTVLFYEKRGCVNNTRQKKLLAAAGHRVVALDLLSQSWSPERLRPFFGTRPVAQWFNPSAPAVKSGAVVPESLGDVEALALMVMDPLLIRRPLMQVGSQCLAGFDPDRVDRWIGLSGRAAGDVESCPRGLGETAPECGA